MVVKILKSLVNDVEDEYVAVRGGVGFKSCR